VVASIIVHRSDERTRQGFEQVLAGSASDSTLRLLESAESRLNPDAVREIGIAGVLARQGRMAEAVALLRRLAAREPENAFVWVSLARVQVTAGRLAEARRSYDRARALNSRIPERGLPPPV
jgi:Flp pilus assembly protein TadD